MAAWLRNRADVIWTVLVACAGFALYACTAAPSVLMATPANSSLSHTLQESRIRRYPYTMLVGMEPHRDRGKRRLPDESVLRLWDITAGITIRCTVELAVDRTRMSPRVATLLSILPAMCDRVRHVLVPAIIAEVYGLNSAFVAAIPTWLASVGQHHE